MTPWKRYLLYFAQEHIEFRFAEIKSLLSLLNIQMKYVEKPTEMQPFWIVQFPSEADAKLLTSRSVSLRSCLELWAHAKETKELHEQLRAFPKNKIDEHLGNKQSFKIEVETFCRHFTQQEKVDKIETFSYLPMTGPVRLKNPEVHLQYIEYYGTEANSPPENPYNVFFGRLVAHSLRDFIKTISLKTRKFIANTSMDPQLSLLMANQAKVTNGDLVLDPFVGSGSLLVAAAHFGGYVWGTDIDYLLLHGKTRPSRIKQEKRAKDESIRENMRQYNLENKYLDILINDFAMPFWKDGLQFDSIITDPPYGIREAVERIGTSKDNFTVEEKHLSTHYPAKMEYGISNIYKDLLIFAAKHLKLGGRLVCWFPIFREDYIETGLPCHPCLELIANSEQVLSKATSRRLLTFEKIKEPSMEDNFEESNIVDFREKYFIAKEESRQDRRIRMAKLKEENRIRAAKNNKNVNF